MVYKLKIFYFTEKCTTLCLFWVLKPIFTYNCDHPCNNIRKRSNPYDAHQESDRKPFFQFGFFAVRYCEEKNQSNWPRDDPRDLQPFTLHRNQIFRLWKNITWRNLPLSLGHFQKGNSSSVSRLLSSNFGGSSFKSMWSTQSAFKEPFMCDGGVGWLLFSLLISKHNGALFSVFSSTGPSINPQFLVNYLKQKTIFQIGHFDGFQNLACGAKGVFCSYFLVCKLRLESIVFYRNN